MLELLNDGADNPVAVNVRAWHRLVARFRRTEIDRQLADGCPPDTQVCVLLRARELESASVRRRLALNVLRILADARSGSRRSGLPVPVCRQRVCACSEDLAQLAGCLLAPTPVSSRGVAKTVLLLTDARSPLYLLLSTEDLATRVQAATAALDPMPGQDGTGRGRRPARGKQEGFR